MQSKKIHISPQAESDINNIFEGCNTYYTISQSHGVSIEIVRVLHQSRDTSDHL